MYTKTIYLLSYFISRRIKNDLKKIRTLSGYLDYAYNFKFFLITIAPKQIKSEILTLLKILNKVKPRVVCEIGTALGGTLFLFSRILCAEGCLISLDLPGGKFGGGYPKWKIPMYRSFVAYGTELHLIRADSHSKDCVKQLEKILKGRQIDFLFIDGDHTYEGVRQDFENYKGFVDSKGIIAFHDIIHVPHEPEWKVYRFWNQIKKEYKNIEIIEGKNQPWGGIGILFLDQELCE